MIGTSKVIGVTGTIASGKSAVGKILQERGWPVIDTDEIVHDLFAQDDDLRAAIQKRFGDEALTPDGSLVDRTKLGALVFSNQQARLDLESIVHPATIAECNRRVATAAQNSSLVFVLVPLLFEAQQEARYDEVWAVHTDEETLRQRLKQRNSLADEEITRRLAAQLTQTEKRSRANRIIDNSGTISNTIKQVEQHLLQTAVDLKT